MNMKYALEPTQRRKGAKTQSGEAPTETAEYAKYAEEGEQIIPYSAYSAYSAVPLAPEIALRLRTIWAIAGQGFKLPYAFSRWVNRIEPVLSFRSSRPLRLCVNRPN